MSLSYVICQADLLTSMLQLRASRGRPRSGSARYRHVPIAPRHSTSYRFHGDAWPGCWRHDMAWCTWTGRWQSTQWVGVAVCWHRLRCTFTQSTACSLHTTERRRQVHQELLGYMKTFCKDKHIYELIHFIIMLTNLRSHFVNFCVSNFFSSCFISLLIWFVHVSSSKCMCIANK